MNTTIFKHRNQSGFHIVELGLVVVAVVILGGVGYLAYTNFVLPAQDPVAAIPKPQDIHTVADLRAAASDLDRI